MDKPEITDSQEKDPDYNFHSSSQESIHFMDKLMTESAENSTSAGKSKLSDSSLTCQRGNEVYSFVCSKTRGNGSKTRYKLRTCCSASSGFSCRRSQFLFFLNPQTEARLSTSLQKLCSSEQLMFRKRVLQRSRLLSGI